MSSRARRPRSTRRVVGVSAVAVGALLSTYAGALRAFSYARVVAPAAATCSAGAVLVSDDTQLQAAIASSGDDSIICVTTDITLSATLLIDDTTITLEGREVGGRDPVLSGDYARRIVDADFTDNSSDDTLTVRDLGLVAGRASGQGGAVLLRGGNRSDALVMTGVEVAGNYSTDDGGGVSARDLSSVYLEGSAFHDDTVGDPTAGDISGGALKVANTGQTTIKDSNFFDNSSVEWGGAVLLNDAGVVTISGSTFQRNSSGTNAGGAIEVDIDDSTLPGSLYISDTVFQQNTSTLGAGGAIRVDDNDDTVLLDRVTFDRNATGSGSGGGLNISAQSGPVVLRDITAIDNSAGSSGGFLRVSNMTSTLTIDGLDSRRNEASVDGGSIKQTTSGSLTVLNSTFVDDSAGVDGGAIYTSGLLRVDVANSQFTGNYARDDAAGLMVRDTPSAYITSSLFRLNSVVLDDGGGILINNADDTISLTDVTLDRNSTGAEGGGVKIVSSDGTVIMDGITATGNSAGTSGGAAYISRPVYSVIENSTFVGNRATQGGGGIYANGVVALYLNFLTATGNYASEGGGLSLDDTVGTSIVNSIVAGNAASSSGSDVYVDGTSSLDDSYSLFTTAGSVVGATISGPGSKFGVPKLNSLADNGGPTQTMLPQWDSPAVKAGDPNWTAPPANDQRGAGFPRDAGGRVNMGAIQGASAQPPAPTYPPSAPRDVEALAGDGLAVVSWAAPASSGSFRITNYQIDDSTGTVSALVQVPSGEPLTATLEDLVNGESYAFRVRALNGAGWGPWSEYSETVTPGPEAAIVITGSRKGRYVKVRGTSTGIDGQILIPRIRFAGSKGYRDGVSRPRVSATGTFTWRRKTVKRTFVYFYTDDGGLRSNRVIIRARR